MIQSASTATATNANSNIAVEVVSLSKRFGSVLALDDVSIKVQAGSLHALLGENGAGKSTLVKCMMGFYRPSAGQIIMNSKEVDITDPRVAKVLGMGMVYQHFTLVPSLTAAENLVISQADCPAVINWQKQHDQIDAFLKTMPFDIPTDKPVYKLAAGQKQKLEILKQLYLGSQLLILDEPTSVLTPAEADEVLSLVKDLCRQGQLTVLMITHKFREVSAYADSVSVLRQGRLSGGGQSAEFSHDNLAELMMGNSLAAERSKNKLKQVKATISCTDDLPPVLQLRKVKAQAITGIGDISIDKLDVRSGEIVGVAGVSGNGQSELMEILTGQRAISSGSLTVNGKSFVPSRKSSELQRVRYVPEEPLLNACAASMSVAENLALRTFDRDDLGRARVWLNTKRIRNAAQRLIESFKIKTASIHAPMASLSGGNVQRSVLARELTGDIQLLIVSNPCFGLDFAAVSEIRQRLVNAKKAGTAILLISEDLDEILELADAIVVMSGGNINYQSPAGKHISAITLGHYMAGHQTDGMSASPPPPSYDYESHT